MSVDVDAILTQATKGLASDAHFTVGLPAHVRVDGEWVSLNDTKLSDVDCESVAKALLGEARFGEFLDENEADISYSIKGVGRFRVNVFRQRGSIGVAARVLPYEVPAFEKLGLPADKMKELASIPNGMVLVCGATGSGKSTTLAAMIAHINKTEARHIVTVEDPVEFMHPHQKSIVDQREVGVDTRSFAEAMRRVLRQTPDVVLVGEIRDPETVSTALMIAETGHLLLSTIHAADVMQGLSRMVDIFPEGQRNEVRMSLSLVLRGMIVQQLLPGLRRQRRVLAYEFLLINSAVKNLIREGKFEQVYNQIHTGHELGMRTMNSSLFRLWRSGDISEEMAMLKSPLPVELKSLMERARVGSI